MEIKKLSEGMLERVAAIYARAYGDHHEVDQQEARNYLEKFLRFDPECCYVAEEGEQTLGAVFAYSYRRFGQDVLYLQELFVDPDHRHKGVGRELVKTVRDHLGEDARVNVVPLVKADTGVLNFYNSLGFEQDQTFSFFDE
jgi:ribosomal protein S18 acetylase RimI-like enzyme